MKPRSCVRCPCRGRHQAGGQTENPAGGTSGVFGSAYGGCGHRRRSQFSTNDPAISFQKFYGELQPTRKAQRCAEDLGTLPLRDSSGRYVSACRCAIDPFFARRQWTASCRGFLFIEIGRQQPDDIVAAEFAGPRDQGAIPSNLIVFDCLRRPHNGGVSTCLPATTHGEDTLRTPS